MANSRGTSDWEQLQHWKFCVGGKYQEVRRKTTVSAVDDVTKGFKIGAAAANLIPGGVGLLASAAVSVVGWTLGALGLFERRERSYKLARKQFKKMFQEDLQIPLMNLTDKDWCIATPEIQSSAIHEIVESFRKHVFEGFNVPYRYDDASGRWLPTDLPGDQDARHYVQCVDHLIVLDVQNLPYQVEWLFAFDPFDQVAMDIVRSVGTDLANLSAQERDQAVSEMRQRGDSPSGGTFEEEAEDGEPEKKSNTLIFVAIAVAALIYFGSR